MEIEIRVIPRASRTALAGVRGHAVLIRLLAPPVDGAANDTLIEFLADVLGVPRRSIRLLGGERSRQKRVAVAGVTAAHVRAALLG